MSIAFSHKSIGFFMPPSVWLSTFRRELNTLACVLDLCHGLDGWDLGAQRRGFQKSHLDCGIFMHDAKNVSSFSCIYGMIKKNKPVY